MSTRFSDLLRDACQPAWAESVDHRFVRELFAGRISDAHMGSYLVQDHRFIDAFLTLLGGAIASADSFEPRLRFARFAGMIASDENTYFLRCFDALGIDAAQREAIPDAAPTAGFKSLMREAARTGSYAAMLSVLCVAEWLYLDWATRAPQPWPDNFIHREWIELHDNPFFRDFVDFLRSELDRVGPTDEDVARDFFSRAVALELAFFDAVYAPQEA